LASKAQDYKKREKDVKVNTNARTVRCTSDVKNTTVSKPREHYVKRETTADERAARRKELTLRTFAAAYESHNKKR